MVLGGGVCDGGDERGDIGLFRRRLDENDDDDHGLCWILE